MGDREKQHEAESCYVPAASSFNLLGIRLRWKICLIFSRKKNFKKYLLVMVVIRGRGLWNDTGPELLCSWGSQGHSELGSCFFAVHGRWAPAGPTKAECGQGSGRAGEDQGP